MIETSGDYVKTKNTKKELIEITETGAFESIRSFGNFVELLGINSSIFSHLLDIKLIIDYSEELENDENKSIAIYVSEDIDGNNNIHLSARYIDNLVTCTKLYDISEFGNIIDELTTTIVHEVIHSNRDIIVKEGIHISKLLNLSSRLLLGKSNKQKNDEDTVGSYSEYLSNNINLNNLSYEEVSDISDIVASQFGLEESFTEALAHLMVYHKDKDKLYINEYCEEMINKDSTTKDIKLAYMLIDKMSLDDIRWFILSSYEDGYNNRFVHLFKEDYNQFMLNMYSIFTSVYNKSDVDIDEYQESEEIIKRLK